MAIKNFSEEVFKLIEKIVTRTERINSYKGKIPAIEFDLAMEDIRRLYDCFLVVKSIVPEVKAEPVALREEESATVIEEAESVVSVKEAVATEPADQPESGTPSIKEPVAVEGKAEEDKREKTTTKKILADQLKLKEQQSIHDLIAAGYSDTSISTRMQHHPISNLKSAIGINEKFIFVYELFNGNVQQYSEAIDQLNSMPGRNEAIALMEILREKYHWDIENMAFHKLVDMVTRRYS